MVKTARRGALNDTIYGRPLVEMYSMIMSNVFRWCLCLLMLAMVVPGCNNDSTTTEEPAEVPGQEPAQIPAFNRDSAYNFVAQQVAFGPRNLGSEGIEACRTWMVSKLEQYGATVIEQEFTARLYTGDQYPAVNIIGQFNPQKSQRVLLAAHYDTRFMAEEDDDPARINEPIDGADDGGSGVGVLLEIARLISEQPIDLGVDIIFFDAEDQGRRGEGFTETWCLGSQHWGLNMHKPGYKARFGILLDMVGARNAFFNTENVAGLYPHANQVHELYRKTWNLARAMGKGRYFQNRRIPAIIDDHYFVNMLTGIPMIDIINKPPGTEEAFGEHWHTHNDNMDIIDKNTLAAVGQVVTAIIYRTSTGHF